MLVLDGTEPVIRAGRRMVMKRTLAVLVLAVLVACGRSGTVTSAGAGTMAGPGVAGQAAVGLRRDVAVPGAEAAAVATTNGFGLDLLRLNLGRDKGNVAVSPWSIATALSMVRAGARGARGPYRHLADRAVTTDLNDP